MKNQISKKRYWELNYEVGRLPSCLIHSRLFWGLPYEFRRFLYAISSPRSFRNIYSLRSLQSKNLNYSTLKPFIETQSIFIHVPKSAGVSLGCSLYGRKTGDHRTIGDYKLCFSSREFKSYFKFAFVRNPWDRLFSAYSYIKKGGRNKQDYDWSMKYLSPFNSFEEFVTNWVNKENIQLGLHFKPQHEFLCTKGFNLEIDFIGYFENIAHDYEYIRRKTGVGRELATMNKTNKRKDDYRHFYNETTKAIVEDVYGEDILIFGYNFEGTSLENQLAKR